MAIKRVRADGVKEAADGLWSNSLMHNGVCYVSGLTSRGIDFVTIEGKDEYEQSKVIFSKMEKLVEAAGDSMADMMKMTIFVTRMEHRKLVWEARKEFFSGDFPACSLVEVAGLASPEIFVEIEGIAHIGASKS